MATTTREELIDYCLRSLGAPVIEINIDPDQVEDRVDEALQHYQHFHSDALHHDFFLHQVTAADVTNKYITLEESMAYVVRILPMTDSNVGSVFSNMWQLQAQATAAALDVAAGGISTYVSTMMNIEGLKLALNGWNRVRFARHMDRIYIEDDMTEGDYVVVEGYRIVDELTYSDVWNDLWLKRYATALIKRNWGANLIKYEGIQLPGGMTFNGRQLFDDANQEIEKLELEIRDVWEAPPDFYVG